MTWAQILEKLKRYRKFDRTGILITWHGEQRFYYRGDWCCPDAPMLARVPRQDLDGLKIGAERR